VDSSNPDRAKKAARASRTVVMRPHDAYDVPRIQAHATVVTLPERCGDLPQSRGKRVHHQ
jgi:hypothetical protein